MDERKPDEQLTKVLSISTQARGPRSSVKYRSLEKKTGIGNDGDVEAVVKIL
jgi:hypothetical protein